jgi:hypothetical protein
MSALLLVVGCNDSPAPPDSLQLSDRFTLAVTDIAPERTAGLRIVGGRPATEVTIVSGDAAGGPTCPWGDGR